MRGMLFLQYATFVIFWLDLGFHPAPSLRCVEFLIAAEIAVQNATWREGVGAIDLYVPVLRTVSAICGDVQQRNLCRCSANRNHRSVLNQWRSMQHAWTAIFDTMRIMLIEISTMSFVYLLKL
jgi:hypothetical protein